MKFIAQRLVQMLAVLFVVTFLTFGLVRVLPGDPAVSIIGTTQEQAEKDPATKQRVEELRDRLDLDEPVHVAYFAWLKTLIVDRDLGYSEIRQTEVSELLGTALPRSILLMVYSIALSLILAIPLGILAAYRQGGWIDRALSASAFGLISLPSFIIAILLVYVFAIQLDWLPASGVTDFSEDPVEHFKSYLLPALALALPQAAVYMRVLRTDMIATLQEDFIGTAKAKGMPPRTILLRHAFRPSSFTLLTVTALTIGQLIGGTVIIEFIFNINGMGSQLAGALGRSDYIVVQSAVAIIAVFFVMINFTVDIFYGLIDPRIRHVRGRA
jgi:peptide/nickel transport system permease protein